MTCRRLVQQVLSKNNDLFRHALILERNNETVSKYQRKKAIQAYREVNNDPSKKTT